MPVWASWGLLILLVIGVIIWAMKYIIAIIIGVAIGMFLLHVIQDVWARVKGGVG